MKQLFLEGLERGVVDFAAAILDLTRDAQRLRDFAVLGFPVDVLALVRVGFGAILISFAPIFVALAVRAGAGLSPLRW